MDGWQTTVVEIRGWYHETNLCRPPPEVVVKLKKGYSDRVSEIPRKIVHHRNEQPAWKWLASLAKDVDCSETAHLLALMSVTQALKPHIGLADRVKGIFVQLKWLHLVISFTYFASCNRFEKILKKEERSD